MRRYMLFIPLLMMILAALACDSYTPDAPKVVQIEADSGTPGKAYARVKGEISYSQVEVAYETTDYGQSWHKADHTFGEPPEGDFNFYSENLYYARSGIRVWSFPRATFRFFFAPELDQSVYFQFPGMKGCSAVSEADPSIVYICMGTEGVLVGPNPAVPSSNRPWQLSSKGIDAITPLPLTITNPVTITVIIILALIFPPLSWLHIWLLKQVWRYVFPVGEAWRALNYAAVVTGIITLLAAGAIIFWLTNVQTDYYPVVAVMTLVTLVLSTGAAIRLARKHEYSDKFVRRLALATGLVSLIVPIGVACIWVAWPVIITLIVGFAAFRNVLNYYLDRRKTKITLWQTDQLTLGILVICTVVLAPIVLMTLSVVSIAIPYDMRGVVSLAAVGVVLIVGVAAVRFYVGWQARSIIVKKNTSPGEIADEAPLFSGAAWWGPFFGGVLVWIVSSVFLSGLLFYAQAMAKGWFQTLLIK